MTIYSLDDIAPVLPPAGHYWAAPDASIIGNVTLGIDVGIWFGAVLRGDIEPIVVGEGTNIQEHTVVHTDAGYPTTIGARCTIGHRAIIHGCTIGNNVLIGMGAIVLNGAVIGENTLIGAGALVPERKEIPAGSLVIGMPGKVARVLSPEEIAGISASADRYIANWKRFAKGLA